MIGNPSSGSVGGDGVRGMTLVLRVVQRKGIVALGFAAFEWMYLSDWRAGGVTLKDP